VAEGEQNQKKIKPRGKSAGQGKEQSGKVLGKGTKNHRVVGGRKRKEKGVFTRKT